MDFNGIILNDEPFHLELYQRILSGYGITLSSEDYAQRYLVLDDEDCFRQILKDHQRKISEQELESLAEQKRKWYKKEVGDRLVFFPGVVSFAQKAASRYSLAIVSGARRTEILAALGYIQLLRYFPAIVSADDVTQGKPNPEGLFLACASLNERLTQKSPDVPLIESRECLVIEDAVLGIEMAHRAKMKCLAITNSYPAELLKQADLVKQSLQGVSLEELEALFQ